MTKTTLIILTIIFSAFCINISHAEIYKWVDEAGNVHFSDTPVNNNAEKLNIYVTPPSETPTATTRSTAKTDSFKVSKPKTTKNKKVVMYGTDWCGYCKKARKYFNNNGISFVEYDVEKLPSRMREFKKLGGTGYPLILIGNKQKMHGFNAANFENRYNKL